MSPWWYVWAGICIASALWAMWDHVKDYTRRERMMQEHNESLERLCDRVTLLESRCDAISSSIDPGFTTSSDEFTCPRCGGHEFGLYDRPRSTVRYCRGADGASNCGYKWPAVDDHLYFNNPRDDKSLS